MRIKSCAPLPALILSLFAIGIICLESVIPAAIIVAILHLFRATISHKTFFIVLAVLTIIRSCYCKPAKYNIYVKEEK